MRISIIGPGDKKYHYEELFNMSSNEINDFVENLAKTLVENNIEIAVTPDKGIFFDIAESYKRQGGKKVFGVAPISDKTYGIKHIEPFLNEEIDGKKIVDEIIDTNTWYQQDVSKCIFGEVILMLGYTLGSFGELAFGYYIYKIASGQKLETVVPIQRIHPKAIAGKRFPLSTIIFMPFVKQRLPQEIESYINKLGGKVFYVHTTKELAQAFKKVQEKFLLEEKELKKD